MKTLFKFISVIIIAPILLVACQTNSNYAQEKNSLIGDISHDQLITAYPYFKIASNTEIKSNHAMKQLKLIKEPTHLTVYFGVWCHDSVREVPALMQLLSEVNNPNISYQLISLDRSKQEPQGRARANGIVYTPTIVVHQDNSELGRIIEKPTQSLATDLAKILSASAD